jgi:hypothetical protein
MVQFISYLGWGNRSNNVVKCRIGRIGIIVPVLLILLSGCARTFHDPNMDFGSIQTVAVMPFENLSHDKQAGERVRDVFSNLLLSTGSMYVLPPGEVARGIARAGVSNPYSPSAEELVKLAGVLKAQAVITGVVREYGEVRSGTSVANMISLSLQMRETETGRIVWSGATTKGGITVWDRLFGGGGEPMNDITVEAVNDLLQKFFH